MKRTLLILATALLLTACGDSEKQLKERAAELCKYIPDHELLEQSRDEQTMRQAISDYLVGEIGEYYLKGDICIPTLMIVASEQADSDYVPVLCDCWVLWYNIVGDTLKCVSGGNHAGLMNLDKKDGQYTVTSFEQTVDGAGNQASAKRIFGSYYDIYQNMHSNEQVREAVRKEQLSKYVKQNGLPYRYYQDYGWPVVEL